MQSHPLIFCITFCISIGLIFFPLNPQYTFRSVPHRGFDISGLYGKTWWGDMGFEDRYGEPLYSYITFTSGAFTDHGVGTEERCYYNDELYRVYKFDWEIQNGWLYLYYSDGYTFIIEYPSVSGRYFYGTAEDGFEIRLEWVDGRSIRKK